MACLLSLVLSVAIKEVQVEKVYSCSCNLVDCEKLNLYARACSKREALSQTNIMKNFTNGGKDP